jgi:SOS-response transcriptional repressor LexA
MLENNVNPKTGLPMTVTLPSIVNIANAMCMNVNMLMIQADDIDVDLDSGTRVPTPWEDAFCEYVNTYLTKVDLSETGIAESEKEHILWSINEGRMELSFEEACEYADQLGLSMDEIIGRNKKTPATVSGDGLRIGRAYENAPAPIKRTVEVALEPYVEEISAELCPPPPKAERLRDMPLYLLPVAAGSGEFLDSDDFDIVEVDYKVPISAHFGVRISGESMSPNYPHGWIAWVRRSPTVEPGQVGVFMLNGEGYIKKMGHGELISLNPDYDPIPIPEDGDGFRVSGVVVGLTEDSYK